MTPFTPTTGEYQLPARIPPEYLAAELLARQPHGPWALFTVDSRTGQRVGAPRVFETTAGMDTWVASARRLGRDVWIGDPKTAADDDLIED